MGSGRWEGWQKEGIQVFAACGSAGGFLPYPKSPDSSWGRHQTLNKMGILHLPSVHETLTPTITEQN